mmetsp:Transcript_5302/g.14900  ORF Transcript_5302/g.14900 Transcript_5302/m.14900 type:complete len:271 (-) Transcript_5302:219-1031(-)
MRRGDRHRGSRRGPALHRVGDVEGRRLADAFQKQTAARRRRPLRGHGRDGEALDPVEEQRPGTGLGGRRAGPPHARARRPRARRARASSRPPGRRPFSGCAPGPHDTNGAPRRAGRRAPSDGGLAKRKERRDEGRGRSAQGAGPRAARGARRGRPRADPVGAPEGGVGGLQKARGFSEAKARGRAGGAEASAPGARDAGSRRVARAAARGRPPRGDPAGARHGRRRRVLARLEGASEGVLRRQAPGQGGVAQVQGLRAEAPRGRGRPTES